LLVAFVEMNSDQDKWQNLEMLK